MSFMDRQPVSGSLLRENRRARLVRGTLRMANDRAIAIVVRNLSERGLGVTARDKPPATGEQVTISLPGSDELTGVVRWVRGNAFGIELAATVDTDAISATLQRQLAQLQEQSDWTVSSLHRVIRPQSNGPRRRV